MKFSVSLAFTCLLTIQVIAQNKEERSLTPIFEINLISGVEIRDNNKLSSILFEDNSRIASNIYFKAGIGLTFEFKNFQFGISSESSRFSSSIQNVGNLEILGSSANITLGYIFPVGRTISIIPNIGYSRYNDRIAINSSSPGNGIIPITPGNQTSNNFVLSQNNYLLGVSFRYDVSNRKLGIIPSRISIKTYYNGMVGESEWEYNNSSIEVNQNAFEHNYFAGLTLGWEL